MNTSRAFAWVVEGFTAPFPGPAGAAVPPAVAACSREAVSAAARELRFAGSVIALVIAARRVLLRGVGVRPAIPRSG